VFSIQSEIVQQIIAHLQVAITPKEQAAISERPTKDVAAYGLYVRAKALIETVALNGQIQERLSEAINLLEQAVVRDPSFYLAYCQLAAAHDSKRGKNSEDRKSTCLNSSHVATSYAGLYLKKKRPKHQVDRAQLPGAPA